ncbi:MAG: hypothetical protein ACYDCL_21180 [Myxococcales bacterium]
MTAAAAAVNTARTCAGVRLCLASGSTVLAGNCVLHPLAAALNFWSFA